MPPIDRGLFRFFTGLEEQQPELIELQKIFDPTAPSQEDVLASLNEGIAQMGQGLAEEIAAQSVIDSLLSGRGEFGLPSGATPVENQGFEVVAIPVEDRPLPQLDDVVSDLGGAPDLLLSLISPSNAQQRNQVFGQARGIIADAIQDREKQRKLPTEHELNQIFPTLRFREGEQVAGPLQVGEPRRVISPQVRANDPRLGQILVEQDVQRKRLPDQILDIEQEKLTQGQQKLNIEFFKANREGRLKDAQAINEFLETQDQKRYNDIYQKVFEASKDPKNAGKSVLQLLDGNVAEASFFNDKTKDINFAEERLDILDKRLALHAEGGKIENLIAELRTNMLLLGGDLANVSDAAKAKLIDKIVETIDKQNKVGLGTRKNRRAGDFFFEEPEIATDEEIRAAQSEADEFINKRKKK